MKLPLDCPVDYIDDFLNKKEADTLYQHLIDNYNIQFLKLTHSVDAVYEANYGKIMFLTKDLFEGNQFPNSVWGPTALWSEKLKEVKNKVEEIAKKTFDVGVCIYYPDGASGVDYHSDFVSFGDTNCRE